ncbi:hypothetical protein MLD38_017763 [Melastoma candidum]|uniref:Uncharacterized protein n=1 Tax=Melastoma candidum TaxID=119954 RepID=A0ACB9QZY0_9MYRT|nr:hypothetical protein MLD38_017763 [Melastoma candidum]
MPLFSFSPEKGKGKGVLPLVPDFDGCSTGSFSLPSTKMASELVNSATSSKLADVDWMKNIEICELVARDHGVSKDIVRAIKKRLGNKNANVQLYAVMLLEMLMNNIGECIHKEVTESRILSDMVKIVKKKNDLPVRERIFLLLDAAQTSLGGASGKYPQYFSAYYDLVSTGVQFPQRHQTVRPVHPPMDVISNQSSSNPVLEVIDKNLSNGELASGRPDGALNPPEKHIISETGIIDKASNTLEVLKEVLDAVEAQHQELARDEFTLDLVEQCSFLKERVMHLAMTSKEENEVSQAILLNEKLQKILSRHNALLFNGPDQGSNHFDREEVGEDEEAEELFHRLRKGKARLRPGDEDETGINRRHHRSLSGLSIPGERLHRPLIRSPSFGISEELNGGPQFTIPPPPAKHVEREKFFQGKKADTSATASMKGLSLHSRNTSNSTSDSIQLSE